MRKELNGWHKTLIAFLPVILGYVAIFVTPFTNPAGLYFALLMLVIGTVRGLLKSNPKIHPIWIILTFFGVGAAYIAISFTGCFLIAAGLGK